jgi:hypothetical protein
MNAFAVFVLPHSFDVQAVSPKTAARVFLRLSRKFFGNDEFVNEMAAGFLLCIAENLGEFRIDLQDSVMYVEQNDRLWHFGKKSSQQGFLANPFRDGARFYPVWRELISYIHTANPASRRGFENTFRTN